MRVNCRRLAMLYAPYTILPELPRVSGVEKPSWDSRRVASLAIATVSSRVHATRPMRIAYLSMSTYHGHGREQSTNRDLLPSSTRSMSGDCPHDEPRVGMPGVDHLKMRRLGV